MVGRKAILTGALALTLFPGLTPAGASLPMTHDNLIIPGKSIGGLELGTRLGAARKQWHVGRHRRCPRISDRPVSRIYCFFRTAHDPGEIAFGANTESRRVTMIYVSAPGTTVGGYFDTWLRKYRTARGIRIGTPVQALLKAYGRRLVKQSTWSDTFDSYVIRHRGKIRTGFDVARGRVFSIAVWKGREWD